MTPAELNKKTKKELIEMAEKLKLPVKRAALKKDLISALVKSFKKANPPKSAKSTAKRTTAKAVKASASSSRKKTTAKSAAKASRTQTQKTSGTSRRAPQTLDSNQPVKEVPSPLPSRPSNNGDPALEAKFVLGSPDLHDEGQSEIRHELPDSYGEDTLVLLPRDPFWAFCYWEVTESTRNAGYRTMGRRPEEVQWVLRVQPAHSGETNGSSKDVEIDLGAGCWYFQVDTAGTSYFAKLGIKDSYGHFHTVLESNTIDVPRDRPSDVTDERWMSTDEAFQEIYLLSGGSAFKDDSAKSGEFGFRDANGSWTVSSFSSPAFGQQNSDQREAVQTQQTPPLRIDAELILYGGVQPDSKVSLDGDRVPLRPDGTFTLRLALDKGEHQYPISVESRDGKHKQTVIPQVSYSLTGPTNLKKKEK